MEGDRRGSPGQGPGTKTEAGNCPGEQDRATPDQHRHHKSGRRKRGPKEPQFRSRSHARASASATPLLNTRMTASTSQRRHGATARVRPTHGTRHRRHREPGPAPPCTGIRSQKENGDRRSHYVITWDNRNGTHRQTMRRPKQARKTWPPPQVKNDLPCDYSRVDRAGTVKPANRGARDVLKSYVNMTKAKDTALAPERRATEHPNMEHPKAEKTRPRPGRKRAKRPKHDPRCPAELREPPAMI